MKRNRETLILELLTAEHKLAVRDMALQAEKVVVLTESEKFGRRGIVPLNLPQSSPPQPRILVTNRNIPQDVLASLHEKGTEVILAE